MKCQHSSHIGRTNKAAAHVHVLNPHVCGIQLDHLGEVTAQERQLAVQKVTISDFI